MKPLIGDTVIYKSKIDNGPGNEVLSPAMVVRTQETTVLAVTERWGPEPRTVTAADGSSVHETAARPPEFVAELPDEDTVDLVVFGLGKTYREYAVARGDGLGQWTEREVPILDFGRLPDAPVPSLDPTGSCQECSCDSFRGQEGDPNFCLWCNHHVGIHDKVRSAR